MPYRATTEDFQFLFDHVIGYDQIAATDLFTEASPDMAQAVLSEAGKMCEEVLAPINRNGDLTPAALKNGVVRTSPGFDQGYKAIADGGWIGMAPPLSDELVEFADGHSNTAHHMAEDVSAFLMWAAEPKMMARKQAGLVGVVFLTMLSVLLYLTNKRIWAPIKGKKTA